MSPVNRPLREIAACRKKWRTNEINEFGFLLRRLLRIYTVLSKRKQPSSVVVFRAEIPAIFSGRVKLLSAVTYIIQ